MDLRQVLGRRKRVRELYKRTALTLESAGAEAAAVTARGWACGDDIETAYGPTPVEGDLVSATSWVGVGCPLRVEVSYRVIRAMTIRSLAGLPDLSSFIRGKATSVPET